MDNGYSSGLTHPDQSMESIPVRHTIPTHAPHLRREHCAQDGQDFSCSPVADHPQATGQARFVNRAYLVQDDLSAFSLEEEVTRAASSAQQRQ